MVPELRRAPHLRVLAIGLLAACGLSLRADTVEVTVTPRKETMTPAGKQIVQSVTLANQLCHYKLTYDITEIPDRPDEVTSHWWIWTTDFVTLGMPEPSGANWYFQGFFNWHFDGESLYNRPASMRVVRDHGSDGVVEYAWDTPNARATIRFALVAGCDKLLMFGSCEPKKPIADNRLVVTCYPTGFAEPRNRSVTTAARTVDAGGQVTLDLARERWVLYEDTTPGRPGSGSAGLIIGTPDSFRSVSVPVGSYGITSTFTLKPEQQSFALGFYDFPTLAGVEDTREYFRETGTGGAEWLQEVAQRGTDGPIPERSFSPERREKILAHARSLLDRPIEDWRPASDTPAFPWGEKLAGGPIRTVLFCRRFAAYETMELARRLPLDARHLYWDTTTAVSANAAWPYSRQTGQGAVGAGVAANVASALCSADDVEVFLCAGLAGKGIPAGARSCILEQVREGKGLFLVGNASVTNDWPPELFAQEEPAQAEAMLASFSWDQVPGYRQDERGRVGEKPLAVYRYGQGRVVVLRANMGRYSTLVPLNDASDGLEGATDRCLGLCARALLQAAGRPLPHSLSVTLSPGARTVSIAVSPPLQGSGELVARIVDDLDRAVASWRVPATGASLELPLGTTLPGGRRCWLDGALRDSDKRLVGFAAVVLPTDDSVTIGEVALSPAIQVHGEAVPVVDVRGDGRVECRAVVTSRQPLTGVKVSWDVQDALGRVVGQAVSDAPAQGGVARAVLELTPPVTVCHQLDVHLARGDDILAAARQRFTRPLPYPYDDFTILMWSYAGGEPVLQRTNRECYRLGADMMDLCHMGGYSDAGAAREYEIAARSGMRVLPYVTRLSGQSNDEHVRSPCLHDPAYVGTVDERLTVTTRQAAPYSPVAFTLGDENYLLRGSHAEACQSPETMAAFRAWLRQKYETTTALNAVWGTSHQSFEDIQRAMLIEEAAEQTVSFAPWLDHKRFMDTAFARAHEHFADTIREQVPGAKVGWDGLLGYHWKAGYDFRQLCANLELNQTYTSHWFQGELVRSFKRQGALTGKWGNAIADNEAGFSAWPWDCLFAGDNSVWWWTSWGCDYIPFNPDTSLSDFGKWFFPAAREVAHGPGKLLLHGERLHSEIAVLYSQTDFLTLELLRKLGAPKEMAGGAALINEQQALARGIHDLGFEYRHLALEQLRSAPKALDDFEILFLTYAVCLSDEDVDVLTRFVSEGGKLVVNGRAGLLSGDGRIRERAALDELLGVESLAGLPGLKEPPADATVQLPVGTPPEAGEELPDVPVRVLSPSLRAVTARRLLGATETPVLLANNVGGGLAVTLNFPWRPLHGERLADGPQPLTDLLDALLGSAGCLPFSRLRLPDGRRPKAVRHSVFCDHDNLYLCLQQDILLPALGEQTARLRLDVKRSAVVYDLRAGQRIGQGEVREWDVTLSRGRPLVFSLLPYAVRAVAARPPSSAKPGARASVDVVVTAEDATPGYHVVRMNVFAPGSDAPHREYSRNIGCPEGRGTASIPFALSDTPGEWRLELKDVASGVTASALLTVAERE